MSGITVSNLCKTYIVNKRQNNVLRNVNLTLEEKEMIAVMGPSGSAPGGNGICLPADVYAEKPVRL